MARRQCDNCGAPYEISAEVSETPRRCSFCGALLETKRTTLFGLQRPTGGSRRSLGIIVGAVAALLVVSLALALLTMRGSPDTAPSAAARSAAPPAPPPVIPPPPAPLPPVTSPPAAPPPRERTVHDDIRDFFLKVDGRLCVAGNLSRFGPFAGSVELTAHPEGRVSRVRITLQPEAPAVTRCLRKAFSRGPVYRGRPVGVVYHFGGGRSADGLQYREGIELKGSAD